MEDTQGVNLENQNSSEIQNYDHVNLSFVFEDHVIDTPNFEKFNTKVDQLVQQMHQIFKKGQRNITFFEMAYQTKDGPLIQEGFEKFKSMSLAVLYAGMEKEERDTISAEELLANLKRYISVLANDSMYAYQAAQNLAFDTVRSEGFDVIPKFENTADLDHETETNRTIQGLVEGKDYNDVLRGDPRNPRIVEQVVNLANQAQTDNADTNIMVLMGTDHSSLFELLPQPLLERSTAVSQHSQNATESRQRLNNFIPSKNK